MAEPRPHTPESAPAPERSSTPPTASSSSRAAKSEGRKFRLAAGLTYSGGVATGGEVVNEEELGPGFEDLDEAAQKLKWGRVVYSPVGKDDEEAAPKEEEARGEVREEGDLKDLSDEEVLETAHAEGIHYPAGTKREIVEGAIKKTWANRQEALEEAQDKGKDLP